MSKQASLYSVIYRSCVCVHVCVCVRVCVHVCVRAWACVHACVCGVMMMYILLAPVLTSYIFGLFSFSNEQNSIYIYFEHKQHFTSMEKTTT